jgi:hypothetical protein
MAGLGIVVRVQYHGPAINRQKATFDVVRRSHLKSTLKKKRYYQAAIEDGPV